VCRLTSSSSATAARRRVDCNREMLGSHQDAAAGFAAPGLVSLRLHFFCELSKAFLQIGSPGNTARNDTAHFLPPISTAPFSFRVCKISEAPEEGLRRGKWNTNHHALTTASSPSPANPLARLWKHRGHTHRPKSSLPHSEVSTLCCQDNQPRKGTCATRSTAPARHPACARLEELCKQAALCLRLSTVNSGGQLAFSITDVK